MESYEEMKDRQQAEFNAFPMMFAFTPQAFAEGMARLGLDPEDQDKIYSCGDTGGFYRKEDAPALHEMMRRFKDELADAMQDDLFAVKAIRYELANHEYIVTNDPIDALETLDITLEAVRASERLQNLLNTAIRGLKGANGW